MRSKGYQNYFDDEILAANPLKLVHLLYRGALDSVVSARRYLRVGDIPARSRAITKAMLIVTELSRSLNMQAGGEMSRNLAELYDYILKLLIQANTEQREAPLSEADRLLSTLLEAWSACLPAEPMPSDDQPGALYGAEYEAEPLAVSY